MCVCQLPKCASPQLCLPPHGWALTSGKWKSAKEAVFAQTDHWPLELQSSCRPPKSCPRSFDTWPRTALAEKGKLIRCDIWQNSKLPAMKLQIVQGLGFFLINQTIRATKMVQWPFLKIWSLRIQWWKFQGHWPWPWPKIWQKWPWNAPIWH